VVDWVRKLKERGPTSGAPASAPSADSPLPPALSWKDFAVFYRTNALSRVIEDAFRAASIPYTLVRGTAFFQREEIRNATGYLRVLANPADSVSLERVINTPARGISDATWEKIVDHAALTGASTMDVCRSIEQVPGLTTRAVASVQKFTQMLDDWAGAHVKASEFMGAEGDKPRGNLRELVDRVIKESGLDRFYEKEDERRENLAELVSSAAEFEQEWQAGNRDDLSEQELSDTTQASKPGTTLDLLRAYLEKIALVADSDAIDPAIGAVTLMTLHAAKGLEYPCVAMIGLEEMVLPHSRAQESEAALEEERRLCFVGVTRAMERLLITSSRFRTVRGLSERTIPSRFLEELRGPETTISDQSGSLAGNDDFDDDNADGHFGEDDGDAGGGGGLRGYSRSGGSRSGPAPFSPGQRVRHPQFGVGTVKHYSGGTNAKVQVDFPGMGTKTLIVEYARLTPA
jgi:DNA helicase-2/ATP-dependent DNA helicase PcrA